MHIIGIRLNCNVSGKKIKQVELADQVKLLDSVREVVILAGGLDLLTKVFTKDLDDLNVLVTEKFLFDKPG